MQELQKNWANILFLSLTPVIGVLGTAAYAIAFGVRWWEPALFLALFGLVSFSVTAGYHRCFAHKAYVSHPAVLMKRIIVSAAFAAMLLTASLAAQVPVDKYRRARETSDPTARTRIVRPPPSDPRIPRMHPVFVDSPPYHSPAFRFRADPTRLAELLGMRPNVGIFAGDV